MLRYSPQASLRVQIAVLIGRGDTAAAISACRHHLDVFQTDAIVWEQLHRLYLDAGQLKQAQFCLEECLLHAPGDIVATLKLADVLYAQGGAKVAAARGYFAMALDTSKGESARALYGVLACEAAADKGVKRGMEGGTEGTRLAAAAQQQLERLYRKRAPGLRPCLDAVLQALGPMAV
jgi:tetratricopeptide (TPR) repeat protein